MTVAYLTSIAWSLLVYGGLDVRPFWLAVTLVFVVERVVTVRDRGPVRMLLAASMYELPYDIFLQVVHGKAYADALLRRERRW
ncbi:hypothetical protein HIDPHFAB_00997 [Nocardioides sp. T2.26MG-1]|nr:hypothetical protein HIDPHFAB_00997 [Nocardioides sp. T2.26MG-1]